MITVRLVALALGLAVAASTSFAQVPAPSTSLGQGSMPLPAPPTGLSRGSMPVSDARAEAIRDCTIAAGRYIDHVWGDWELYVYRACMARHGQPE